MNVFAHRTVVFKVLIFVIGATAAALALSDGPPPAFTGLPGERTCIICHDQFELDAGRDLGGEFDILGVPEQYTPGETYTLTVALFHPGQQRWGFELAARFMDTGAQAGTITPTDTDNTQFQDFDGIRYIYHTNLGTYAGIADGPVCWQFNWTAPDSGPVLFGAAGNAADNDGTSNGDYIYTTRQLTVPVDGSE